MEVVANVKSIIILKNDCLEGIDKDSGNHKEQRGRNKWDFIWIIECIADHVIKNIDGWWIVSDAFHRIAKIRMDLIKF